MKRTIVLGLLTCICTIALGQTITISGTVTDDQGKPVPFAFIKDAQHNYATFSDLSGTFTLDADPASQLMATSNNYSEAVVKINNQPNVKIVMKGGGSIGTIKKSSETFDVHEIGGTDRSARPGITFGTAQEELHGSPYLFSGWVHGYAITPADSILQSDDYLFNYAKVDGALLYTDNGKSIYMIDKGRVKAFTLFDDNGQQVSFENVPAIDPKHYVEVLATGSKYKIYKNLGTKFLKADFETNGISTTGNNYDSYVDEGVYYIVKAGGQPQKVSLKRKAIKTAFGADGDKANKYMSDHDSDEVDDNFLKGLGAYMNE